MKVTRGDMALLKGLVVIVYVYCITALEGSRKRFGLCKVFTREEYESLPDTAESRSCVVLDDSFYCVEWECPYIPCSNPITEEHMHCPYCPNTCSYRGKVYDVSDRPDDAFRCIDGQNTCMCVASGKVVKLTDYHSNDAFNRALNQCFWKRGE